HDQLVDVHASFAVDDALLDVEYERPVRLQHPLQLLGYRQEPVYVALHGNAAVGALAVVSVRRGCDDEVYRAVWKGLQYLDAVSLEQAVYVSIQVGTEPTAAEFSPK